MEISMNKNYTYRNGAQARILCVDGANKNYPVISMLSNGRTQMHTKEGYECHSRLSSTYDLVEVWEPVDKEPVWAWDERELSRRLGFYDTVNKCLFYNEGPRGGASYDNYTKVEHIEQWVLDAQAKLDN